MKTGRIWKERVQEGKNMSESKHQGFRRGKSQGGKDRERDIVR